MTKGVEMMDIADAIKNELREVIEDALPVLEDFWEADEVKRGFALEVAISCTKILKQAIE